ncbi:MAG: ESCRT-III subunit protein snf7 [Watsoniomyces obsoletus]|nr:MAG: ESCRT-III subunit protein snf7 [Watsoniomyces obsoletus]
MSSMLSWITGNGAQKRKAAPKEAIVALREHLDMLQKREQHLQNQMAEQDAIARRNINSNKNAARAALKRKKQYEHTYDQTTAQISTIEQQIYSIEAANINQETLKAMQKAGTAMKQIHGGLTIDKVDETMEQLREQHVLAEEIAGAITNAPITEAVDQDELDEELKQLEQEALDDRMLTQGTTVPVNDRVHNLPVAGNGGLTKQPPTRRPAQEELDEEAELAKLQAEMAM